MKTVSIGLSLVLLFSQPVLSGDIPDKCAARKGEAKCKCYVNMYEYLTRKLNEKIEDADEYQRLKKFQKFYAKGKQACHKD
jgi:hypothetical protein